MIYCGQTEYPRRRNYYEESMSQKTREKITSLVYVV
jgi:hypothetical protein